MCVRNVIFEPMRGGKGNNREERKQDRATVGRFDCEVMMETETEKTRGIGYKREHVSWICVI